MSPQLVAVLGFALLLVLLALKTPIGYAFALVGILGILYLGGNAAVLTVLGTVPYSWSSYFVLLTVPLFILMGNFAFHSGISQDLYYSANKWLGHLPGGLALATMSACALFAACTGSSVASASAMGTISLPEMKRYNYDARLATGTVAIGGTLGILIPPSTVFILYGVLTEESIGRLFIAGVFPGLLLTTAYMLYIFFKARTNPTLAPPSTPFPWKERLVSLKNVWGMVILFLMVMGGIWGGVVTPTEAAAVGAFGAFMIPLLRRRMSKQMLTTSLKDTIKMTGMIFTILIGAMIFTHFLAITNLPGDVAKWVSELQVPRYVILSAILLIYIPLGMFMDTFAMLVLTIPIFYPIVVTLGFDSVWFGVLLVVLAEIGLVTPPVGMNCFIIAGISKDTSLTDVFRGSLPFVVIALVGVVILVAFPQISIWLPNTMFR